MTRVTAPIGQLVRSLSANPAVARPAYLAGANAASNVANWSEYGDREDNARRFTTAHRPTPMPAPSRNRVVPLMQTFNFRTTTPQSAQLDTSSIDFCVMPMVREPAASVEPAIRVPLLPDNYSAHHAPETLDGPVAAPVISIVAAHPDLVTPASALTEIESVGIDGVELKFAHTSTGAGAGSDSQEPGMFQDLWRGLVEDVFGEAPKKTKAV